MSIQYRRTTRVSTELFDMELDGNELFTGGQKSTAGAPVTTAGVFAPGCLIQNQADSDVYRNDGTTAVPVWVAV